MALLDSDLIDDALADANSATSYRIDRALAARFLGKAIFATEEADFDPWRYAGVDGCEIAVAKDEHAELVRGWTARRQGARAALSSGWLDVTWRGHALRIVQACWSTSRWTDRTRRWIVADTMEVAESFFRAVAEYCHAPHQEVVTFNGGCWGRSQELYETIRASSFDDLVLAGTLATEIRADFERFMASRREYERYRVPWKRGVLFVGPPGNGKTHCLRATVNFLGVPCLYVQSFQAKYDTDEANILRVFEHARSLAPCCLVLEDLDAMITDENRSFFLNQLDGFTQNEGMLTLATTNHPERLDPAIVDRPSRFDRKYHFALPGPTERLAYVRMWNGRFEEPMRVSTDDEERLAGATEGFSFAYVKELFVSSMVRWMATREPGTMARVLDEQVVVLRDQMSSAAHAPVPGEGDALKAIEKAVKRALF